jgi:hypothetical protein
MSDERGRRAPTPRALESLQAVPQGYRMLPDPLNGAPLQRIPAQPAEVRLMLSRSSESARAGEPSQDYLVVRHDPRRLTFAVTDGVGSSFLGDVAAQILSAHLTEWFVTAWPPTEEALTAFLDDLSSRVAEQVASWPLPEHLSEIMRDALDAQRSYGSEAMFAAGVVDLSGERQALLTVAWLGDVRLRVILREGGMLELVGRTNERWSSRSGARGQVRTATWPVAEVARILACTDGLVPELDAAVELGDAELTGRLAALATRPRNDDIALVDIGLVPRAIPGSDEATVAIAGKHARASAAGSVVRRLFRPSTPPPASAPPAPPVTADPLGHGAPPHAAWDRVTPEQAASAQAGPPPLAAAQVPATPSAEPAGSRIQAPVIMRRRLDRGQELVWSPVDGADSYAVEISREPTFADPILYAVNGLSFRAPPLPDPVYARLRSVVGGVPGPWGPKYDLSLGEPS